MASYWAEFRFRRFEQIALVEKLRFVDRKTKKPTNDWSFIEPENQLICRHSEKLKVFLDSFKKYRTVRVRLNVYEARCYLNGSELAFRGRPLMTESQYFARFKRCPPPKSFAEHNESCDHCRHVHQPSKKNRKRKRLTSGERLGLAFDLGQGLPYKHLQEKYSVSSTTIKRLKRRLWNKTSANGPVKMLKKSLPKRSALTVLEQKRIRNFVTENIYATKAQIKINCKLGCSLNTIRNFLRDEKVYSFVAKEAVHLNSNHIRLRDEFAAMVASWPASVWQCVLFSDEKTLQSYYKGKIRLYRARGKGADRRFLFRKDKGSRLKLNLFGWISPNGVGDLFVFSDSLKATNFINFLHHNVLPSILKSFGSRFVWQMDNCPIHTSKLTVTYLNYIGITQLLFPPKSPDWNIIENVWSVFQRRVNGLIFKFGQPSTSSQLRRIAFYAWHSIEPELVDNLYHSLPKRISQYLTERAVK